MLIPATRQHPPVPGRPADVAQWRGKDGRQVNSVVNFFRVLTQEPDSFPSVRSQVKKAIQSIDFSRDRIVLWIPGTDESSVPSSFQQALDGVLGLTAGHITYPANYRLEESVDYGVEVLRGVLEYIRERERRTGRRFQLLVAGHSQGAWVISKALSDKRYENMVTRAVLFGHPFIAKHHHHDTTSAKFLEINNPGDIVAIPLKGADKDEVRDTLASISEKGVLSAVPLALKLAIKNPAALGNLLLNAVQLMMPGLKTNYDNVHDYGADMLTAVQFLKDGTRYGRALKNPEPRGGVTPRSEWRDPYLRSQAPR